ncbi:MAG: calcium/sodium antiporter [Firmicutes bacterium]|nr:calcium/sodium antiporter [Bacillota bacterium]
MGLMLYVLLFLVGLFFIIKGGDFLVSAALQFGRATGIGHIVLGATVIAVATTAPEIVISTIAVFEGHYDMAAGNAIGGMMANIALVMAVYIVFVGSRVSRRDTATKGLFLFGSLILVAIFARDLYISLWEGLILIALAVVFFVYAFMSARKHKQIIEILDPPERRRVMRRAVLGFALGQAILIFGATLLVQNGERIAADLGISETVIGFTIVAVGTSSPELVTILAAIKRKSGDLALGNILGSNIINSTLLLGACGLAGHFGGHGMPLSRTVVVFGLPVLFIATVIVILPMLLRGRTYRWQGLALLSLYAAYILYLTIAQPI